MTNTSEKPPEYLLELIRLSSQIIATLAAASFCISLILESVFYSIQGIPIASIPLTTEDILKSVYSWIGFSILFLSPVIVIFFVLPPKLKVWRLGALLICGVIIPAMIVIGEIDRLENIYLNGYVVAFGAVQMFVFGIIILLDIYSYEIPYSRFICNVPYALSAYSNVLFANVLHEVCETKFNEMYAYELTMSDDSVLSRQIIRINKSHYILWDASSEKYEFIPSQNIKKISKCGDRELEKSSCGQNVGTKTKKGQPED
ncbi:hypothetical protein [Teredinibacter turnerae]|uniref:hypothetical protein n=1 Tax=Teredinibacter turnerae TaxID=2426 RepID=UPI00037D088D|nr:hypothetical protein [Teredinibacter turnerae]